MVNWMSRQTSKELYQCSVGVELKGGNGIGVILQVIQLLRSHSVIDGSGGIVASCYLDD